VVVVLKMIPNFAADWLAVSCLCGQGVRRFPQLLQANAVIYLTLGHDRFRGFFNDAFSVSRL
jgi:hypothetical protein